MQYRDPRLDVVKCLLVKEQVFEPRQRTIFIDCTALLEHVAVAFEVVTRSTCIPHTDRHKQLLSSQNHHVNFQHASYAHKADIKPKNICS